MILVAEDNEVLQNIHLKQLAKLGFTGEGAANGLEVMECISRRRYDLILMDISMPEMDGFETARRLRMVESITNSPHTPVVAVSGKSDYLSCINEGLDDFLPKPLMLDKLADVLDRWARERPSTKSQALLKAARTVIKARREALGLTRLQVACKSGYSEEIIGFLETGARDFDLHALSRISGALGLPVIDLVAWIELVAREEDLLTS